MIIPLMCHNILGLSGYADGTPNGVGVVGLGYGSVHSIAAHPMDLVACRAAVSVPVDAVITAICPFFNVKAHYPQEDQIILKAMLYYSETPNNNFCPLADSEVVIGIIPPNAPHSICLNSLHSLCIQIKAQTRLLLAIYLNTAPCIAASVYGDISASLLLEHIGCGS